MRVRPRGVADIPKDTELLEEPLMVIVARVANEPDTTVGRYRIADFEHHVFVERGDVEHGDSSPIDRGCYPADDQTARDVKLFPGQALGGPDFLNSGSGVGECLSR